MMAHERERAKGHTNKCVFLGDYLRAPKRDERATERNGEVEILHCLSQRVFIAPGIWLASAKQSLGGGDEERRRRKTEPTRSSGPNSEPIFHLQVSLDLICRQRHLLVGKWLTLCTIWRAKRGEKGAKNTSNLTGPSLFHS